MHAATGSAARYGWAFLLISRMGRRAGHAQQDVLQGALLSGECTAVAGRVPWWLLPPERAAKQYRPRRGAQLTGVTVRPGWPSRGSLMAAGCCACASPAWGATGGALVVSPVSSSGVLFMLPGREAEPCRGRRCGA